MTPKRWIAAAALALTTTLTLSSGAARAGFYLCAPAPEPVYTLDFGSRYAGNNASRSVFDEDGNRQVDEALGPIDDFLRTLTEEANDIYNPENDRIAVADCVMAQIATWAQENALADLQSKNARLTIASRIAAFGLVVSQVIDFSTSRREQTDVRLWLNRLMQDQMVFWEEEAPDGAKQGNLRAWAALAANVAAQLSGDEILHGWSAWSTQYVLCKASPDGSLPQEMSRGRLALHYQLHAIAPLVLTSARLERVGIGMRDRCDSALRRVVDFVVSDIAAQGQLTAAITGRVQSYFDGSKQIKGFNLAWIEAYLSMERDHRLIALAEQFRPLSHSKLGGNQTLIWGNGS